MSLDPQSVIAVVCVGAALLGAGQAIRDGIDSLRAVGLCALLSGIAAAGVLAVLWALAGLLMRLVGAAFGGGA